MALLGTVVPTMGLMRTRSGEPIAVFAEKMGCRCSDHSFKEAPRRSRAPEPDVVRLSEQDRAFVERAGLDPATVAADMERERRERATRRAAADAPFTAEENETLRLNGHDPRMIAAMKDGATYEDWKRAKAAGRAS